MLKMYAAYYNEYFDCLIFNFSNEKVTNFKFDNTQSKLELYNEKNELIGLNLFNAKKEINNLKPGYCSFDKNVRDYFYNATSIEQKQQFVIGKIIQIEPIINTHLTLCQVDIGENEFIQIVCGASNVREKMFSVIALIGARMPSGLLIISGQLRGLDSNGMICSLKELQLTNNSNYNETGILDLKVSDQLIGTDFMEYYYGN